MYYYIRTGLTNVDLWRGLSEMGKQVGDAEYVH